MILAAVAISPSSGHLAMTCSRDEDSTLTEWDQRSGGDFVWCEPYMRFPPSANTLYLFRVHDGSYHFVQQVAQPLADVSDCAAQEQTLVRAPASAASRPSRPATGIKADFESCGARRLAINGWFVLDHDGTAAGDGHEDGLHTIEQRLSKEGCALHRELQARVLCGREAFVHHVGSQSVSTGVGSAEW